MMMVKIVKLAFVGPGVCLQLGSLGIICHV